MNGRTMRMLSEFEDLEIQTNCCIDIACPECGARSGFKVDARITARVYLDDDGTRETNEGQETDWGRRSGVECTDCGHCGVMGEFTFPGLDEALADREGAGK